MRTMIRYSMIIIVSLYVMFHFTAPKSKDSTVEVIMFDEFKNGDHGRNMARETRKWSLSSCPITEVDTSMDHEDYIRKLKTIAEKVTRDNKKYVINMSMGHHDPTPLEPGFAI